MSTGLAIVDASPTGKVLERRTLTVSSVEVTVREIISERVRDEVERFNATNRGSLFNGLVQPVDAEAELNGYRLKKRRTIDADQQVAKALEALEANGFFLLVNDEQVESLEQRVPIRSTTEVSFVKLVPLVGG